MASCNASEVSITDLQLRDVLTQTLLGNTSLISTCMADTFSGVDMRDSMTAISASTSNDSSFAKLSRVARNDDRTPRH